jgi:hypothetical protein
VSGGTLEARRRARRGCHGSTRVGLGVGRRDGRSAGVIVVTGDGVIDEARAAETTAVLVELGAELLVVGGLAPGLALIEVLLVEGADSVGTLLRVVGGVLWGQRAHSESHPLGVAAAIVGRFEVVWLLWHFDLLVRRSLGAMDVDRRENVVRLAVAVVTGGHITGWQRDPRQLCGASMIGGMCGLGEREVETLLVVALGLVEAEIERRIIHMGQGFGGEAPVGTGAANGHARLLCHRRRGCEPMSG